MEVIFKSPDVIIEEDEKTLIIRRSLRTVLILLAIIIPVSVMLYIISESIGNEAYASAIKWVSYTLATLAVFISVIALPVSFFRKIVISKDTRRMKHGSREIPFSEIKSVKPEIINLMGNKIINVTLHHSEGKFYLIPGHFIKYQKELENLSEKISSLMVHDYNIQTTTSGHSANAPLKSIGALFLIIFGAIFSLSAYIMIPDLVLSPAFRDSYYGVLIWPLGIWVILAGILELTKFPVINISRKKIKRLYLIAIKIIWIASYFAICRRSIN